MRSAEGSSAGRYRPNRAAPLGEVGLLRDHSAYPWPATRARTDRILAVRLVRSYLPHFGDQRCRQQIKASGAGGHSRTHARPDVRNIS